VRERNPDDGARMCECQAKGFGKLRANIRKPRNRLVWVKEGKCELSKTPVPGNGVGFTQDTRPGETNSCKNNSTRMGKKPLLLRRGIHDSAREVSPRLIRAGVVDTESMRDPWGKGRGETRSRRTRDTSSDISRDDNGGSNS